MIIQKISKDDGLLIERLVEKYGAERLLKEFNFKRDIKPSLVAAGIAAAGLVGAHLSQPRTVIKTHGGGFPQDAQEIEDDTKSNNPYGMSDADYELFNEKVDAVNSEIERSFNFKNIPMEDLKFDPEQLVYMCYLHNFDLPLAMAQLHVESRYGTGDRARRTNSMFSIGSYDSGKDVATYASQNDSIEPYIIIMQRDYLQDGDKSVSELLSDGGFVNHNGHRYASSPTYERDVRVTRNGIINRNPVLAQPFSTYNITEGYVYDRNTGKMKKIKLFS